jgi:phosphate starvation-inducible PhoH-like protein
VTGDVTQTDLPSGQKSGLRVVEEILDEVADISFNRLTAHDVVRHKLVGHIVAAYDDFDAAQEAAIEASPAPRRNPVNPVRRNPDRGNPEPKNGAQR